MIKENKKTIIITAAVTLLPILAGVILWDRLPETMATHFGTNSGADGFSSRAFAVFGLPLILLGVHLLCAFVTAADPRKKNISPKMYSLVLWIAPVISLIVNAVIYAWNLGYQLRVSYIVQLLVGVGVLVIGNLLPKARQNYTIGIKTPWALADEENWNRTHRLAGWLWTAGGLVILIITFCGVSPRWLIGVFAVIALIPCIYSAWLHAARGL